ncbi:MULTISPECIES: Hsp70 family protein [unclassified Tolypothrix]|uniref:Hsp70 family protein n=1 Tax=unclassified Tolypothrix TaxID=2649714 RepID=UPI0005EAA377|nr:MULTISPECIES: Hsp70 family protein [unclassified Tolypothrix]BAY91309.1 heat shock protein 70 [Microchaete diplosiphon NIES-3275]EKF04570.1 putative heat shock protein 70 DnaK [Tolypothrix sp. PCC 7601]MBE9080996.1 Hsp70 family protein [Tolypothrix sp. LEGE 11397]UYD25375.1 Hsp70 family protein [Tolypothrix sp. PCC 7712]UYD32380.1 Hsp70 family protein [Tolypothrix sp. PCC 7601]
MLLGIDFGTCNSSAALMLNGSLKLVKEPIKGGYSFPSCVYLTEQGEMLVGVAADNNRLRDIGRHRQEFKRELGTNEPYELGDRFVLPEELVAEVLRKLKSEAEKMLPPGRGAIKNAVITVPATYQQHKRSLMQKAAQAAGFISVRLIEEPVAAATYYAHQNLLKPGEIILVYDLGGGTFDATLIKKQGSTFKILATPTGLEDCGGTDFDKKIYQHLKGRCSQALREQLEQKQSLLAKVQVFGRCIDIKHQLSEAREASIHIPVLGQVESYHLTRMDFNQMIAPYIDHTIAVCDQLLQAAGIEWKEVSQVLLVGGSCRIPYVKTAVENKLGHSPLLVDEPELAVCQGAAIYGTPNTLTVSPYGENHYKSISEALMDAPPNATITVHPGIYQEAIVIDKPIKIEGYGQVAEIIVESKDLPCIWMQTAQAQVKNLTLRSIATQSGNKHFGVDIPQGQLLLENCDITSDSLSCIYIHGSGANTTIRQCQIHHGKQCGILVRDRAQALVEDSQIFRNTLSGVQIREGGNLTIRKSQISDCKQSGIFVYDSGRLTAEDCQIFNNAYSGVEILNLGNLSLQHCQIHRNQGYAIYAYQNGIVSVENCDLRDNSRRSSRYLWELSLEIKSKR